MNPAGRVRCNISSIIKGCDRVPQSFLIAPAMPGEQNFRAIVFEGRMGGLDTFEKTEEDMNRRSLLTTPVPMMLAAALVLPSSIVAQEITLKELLGSWIFVSAQDVRPDGSKVDPWGPNPKGAAMFDANGRFTFMIMRSDLPKFASNNRAQATAEEGKAVAQGMIAFYGTYTINEGDKTLTTRIEGSSYPNLIGGEQKRTITSLTADELRYINPTTSTGTKAESVWRRAK
jgi:hypothetical protein